MINATTDFNSVDLKKRSDLHIARKIWHMTAVSFMAVIYAFAPEKISVTLLIGAWVVFVPADFIRLRFPALNDFAVHLFKPVLRQSEINKLAGTTYLITGVLVVALLFPHDIVLLTLLFLAFADPIASYFGIRFGKDKIFGQKSLQGTMPAFIVCAFLSFCFLYYKSLLLDRLVVASILSGVIGAFAELIPVWKLDDNLTLPIISATALWILFSLFGAFAAYV